MSIPGRDRYRHRLSRRVAPRSLANARDVVGERASGSSLTARGFFARHRDWGHRSRVGGKSHRGQVGGAARGGGCLQRRCGCCTGDNLARADLSQSVAARAITSSKPSRRQVENAAASAMASGSKLTAMQQVPS